MKLITIAFIIISLLVGTVCYLTTLNIYVALAVFVIYVCAYFLFCRKKIAKYYLTKNKVHSCYFFVNSFIITMSVKESYEDAFNSGVRIEDEKLHVYVSELGEMSPYEKVKYLKTYFNLAIYKMFLNLLEIYNDQGGNILSMTDNLIKEITRVEKTLAETVSIGYRHLVEFILLWALSFGVLLFMRFGVSEFYQMMLKNVIFVPLLLMFFIICLASIILFLNSFTNLSIKEDLTEWKRLLAKSNF